MCLKMRTVTILGRYNNRNSSLLKCLYMYEWATLAVGGQTGGRAGRLAGGEHISFFH